MVVLKFVRTCVVAIVFLVAGAAQAQVIPLTRVSGRPTCPDCRFTFTKVVRLGGRNDPELVGAYRAPSRDERGRFYAPNHDGTSVIVYDSTGKYVTAFGRKGQGPGEFPVPVGYALPGNGNSLIAISSFVAHEFTSTYQWSRSTRLVGATGWVAVLKSGSFVYAGPGPNPGSQLGVHIVSRTGTPVGSIGPISYPTAGCSWCFLFAITPSFERDRIWIVTPFEYLIAEYDSTGRPLRRFAIDDSPWFRPWNPRVYSAYHPSSGGPKLPTATRVDQAAADSAGLIWMLGFGDLTGAAAALRSTDAPMPESRADSWRNAATELEIFDSRRGVIWASAQIAHTAMALIGPGLLATVGQSSEGYVYWDVWRARVSR